MYKEQNNYSGPRRMLQIEMSALSERWHKIVGHHFLQVIAIKYYCVFVPNSTLRVCTLKRNDVS